MLEAGAVREGLYCCDVCEGEQQPHCSHQASVVVASMRDAWAPRLMRSSPAPSQRLWAASTASWGCHMPHAKSSSSRPDGFCGALSRVELELSKARQSGRTPPARISKMRSSQSPYLCGWSARALVDPAREGVDRSQDRVFTARCVCVSRSSALRAALAPLLDQLQKHEVTVRRGVTRGLRRALPHRMAAETRRGGAASDGARKR